jgi:hypothetical protein
VNLLYWLKFYQWKFLSLCSSMNCIVESAGIIICIGATSQSTNHIFHVLVKILSRGISVSMLRNHVAINIHTVYCCTEQHLSCYIQVLLVNNTVFVLTSTFLMILKNIKQNRPAVLKDNMVEGSKKLHHATNSELKTCFPNLFLHHIHYVCIQADQFQIFT